MASRGKSGAKSFTLFSSSVERKGGGGWRIDSRSEQGGATPQD